MSPVAKNARLTNSYYGYTGEMHDIEGRMLYLRARYYDFNTSQFMQQDTVLGDIKEPLTRNLYLYGKGNPLTYVDPSGHWSIWVKKNKKTGEISVAWLEFDDSKLKEGLATLVNAIPFGSLIDYFDKIEWVSGKLTSIGERYEYYKYEPDEDIMSLVQEKLKQPGTVIPTISDIADNAKGYEYFASKVSSESAKNLIKSAGTFITIGFSLADYSNRNNKVDRDMYLQAMIKKSDIDYDYIRSISNPEELFIYMTYFEGKLNSYGEDNQELFDEYFDDYWDLIDYSGTLSWRDKLFGKTIDERIRRREYFEKIAEQLREDFEKDILKIEGDESTND
ncbi:RHS repeat-associated core domain-containing protein [Oceanirhabdus sp. W0125-5]|uniref:RHS repeat-associated core domain-containing protein n=1 Tax=Oceanirhabdus sp. W0125-5 TaxID=2999116 RepID=UPI0022F301AD|nr:RHS repeat-associated core domain-containing protein [Oceanirhabdus sp. W0125-5]WBW99796.1 RHS repeat-associated core domain-containing protein [Oceanirhabdus sp. W0125-5]